MSTYAIFGLNSRNEKRIHWDSIGLGDIFFGLEKRKSQGFGDDICLEDTFFELSPTKELFIHLVCYLELVTCQLLRKAHF